MINARPLPALAPDNAPRTPRDRWVVRAGAVGGVAGALVLVAGVGPEVRELEVLGVIGLLLSPTPIAGMIRACPDGASRFLTRSLGTWLTSYLVLILALMQADVQGWLPDGLIMLTNLLGLLAAPVVLIGGAVAGTVAGTDRVLPGWRRWMPLGLALSMVQVVLPLPWTEAPIPVLLLPLFLGLTGIALVTASSSTPSANGGAEGTNHTENDDAANVNDPAEDDAQRPARP